MNMKIKNKMVIVEPVLSPYNKRRFQELAKYPNLELHIVIEKDVSADRTGWKFENIDGCKMHLLNSIDHNFKNKHDSSGYEINNTHRIAIGLRKVIDEIAPDFVIVHNSIQILQLYRNRNYKLGVIVEDTLRAAEGRKWFNKLVKKYLLKKVDFYVPFSKDAEDFLNYNKIFKPFINSSWSVDLDFFQDVIDVEKEKEQLGISKKKRVYLIVSALIQRKGLTQFIEAWKSMGNEFIVNNQLIILGDGPLEEQIKKTVENCDIELLGNKSYKVVSHYLQCSDVFVLPTLEDLCSLSVFEAISAGCPVMTTIYNGARFLVDDGKNGYVFDSENKNSIIDALKKMDKSDIESMSKYSLNKSKRFNNHDVMFKFYEDVMKLYE